MARKKIKFDNTIDFASEEFRKERYEKKLAKYKENLKKRKEVIPENHSCIPPKVKQNDPGEGLAKYDLLRNNRDYIGRRLNSEKSLKETYPNKAKGKPWYFLKPWESSTINSKYEPIKMTSVDYIVDSYKHKIDKWVAKHPTPAEDDMFYNEYVAPLCKEFNKWMETDLHHWLDNYITNHYNTSSWPLKRKKELQHRIDLLRNIGNDIYKLKEVKQAA